MVPTATDVTASACGLSVCVSVTLVHLAKPVDKMRCHFAGILVWSQLPSNTVLDGSESPNGKVGSVLMIGWLATE